MNDLETKTEITVQLANLLQAISLLDNWPDLHVSIKSKSDAEIDMHLEDPALLKVIRDYVYSKAKMLDVNFKLTNF